MTLTGLQPNRVLAITVILYIVFYHLQGRSILRSASLKIERIVIKEGTHHRLLQRKLQWRWSRCCLLWHMLLVWRDFYMQRWCRIRITQASAAVAQVLPAAMAEGAAAAEVVAAAAAVAAAAVAAAAVAAGGVAPLAARRVTGRARAHGAAVAAPTARRFFIRGETSIPLVHALHLRLT